MALNKQTPIFGIRNLGNTCYINSVMHCLRYNKELEHYLLSVKFKKDLKGKLTLIESFYNIVDKTQEITDKTVIRPESFVLKFVKNFSQVALYPQDAHEAIVFLLDKFHNAISKKVKIKKISGISDNSSDNWKKFYEKDFSEIIRIFFGQFEINITCNKCKTSSFPSYEPFNHLQVELTNSLINSLDIALSEEAIEKRCDNCSTTDNVDMTKKFSISMFPSHLILQIKRFTYMNDKLSKKLGKMEVPDLIDLSKYYSYNDRYGMYQLYAGIIHMGSPTYGHYISYCKSENNFWVKYDDDTVITDVNKREVENMKKNSYMLFYKKL